MTNLILIRHGETSWTAARRYQGHSDTELTSKGKQQIQLAAKTLKGYAIDVLYASPLKRAKQSAEIISKAVGKKVSHDTRLKELHFGNWEGKTAEELYREKNKSFRHWSRGKLINPEGGESIPAFRKRVRSFLKDCVTRHQGKTVAVVAHGGPIKMMIFEALKLPPQSLWSLRIEPGAISALTFSPHFAQLVCLNLSCSLKLPMPWLVKKEQ